MTRNVDRRVTVAALNDAVQASNRSAGTGPEFSVLQSIQNVITALGHYYVAKTDEFATAYRLPRFRSGDVGKTITIRVAGANDCTAYAPPGYTIDGNSSHTLQRGIAAVFVAEGSNTYGLIGHRSVDLQTFSATGTWTKPLWATWAEVEVWGGGGGGGGGRYEAGAACFGGSGGGGGGCSVTRLLCSDLSATEAVTIGAGGTGGTGRSATNDGGNGTNAGASDFGTICYGFGGIRGLGGTDAEGICSAGGGRPATRMANPAGERAAYGTGAIATGAEFGGAAGGWSSDTTAKGIGGVSIKGGPGGGAGGHVAAGGAQQVGGTGGSHNNEVETGGGGAGGAAQTDGTAGGEATYVAAGNGGGGGGGANANNAGDGGDGGTAAGGGGGGGGQDSDSGKGGDGGGGYCRVTCW